LVTENFNAFSQIKHWRGFPGKNICKCPPNGDLRRAGVSQPTIVGSAHHEAARAFMAILCTFRFRVGD